MLDPADETLMAYADGLLDPSQTRALEERLAADPQLRARLEPFVVTGRPLARLYQDTLETELPERLVDTIFAKPARPEPATRAARSSSGGLRAWIGALLTDHGSGLRLAGALTAGAAVGVLAGWLARGEFGDGHGPGALLVATARGTMARGELAQALEQTPTGKILRIENGTGSGSVVAPELTFTTDAGTICRQYRLDGKDDGGFAGVACRIGPAEWRVDVHTPTVAAARQVGKVRPASGETAPVVAGAVDKMIASDPLTVKQEEELIRRGWHMTK